MRSMCYTSLRRNIIIGAIILFATAAAITVFVMMLSVKPDFFEKNSVAGVPNDIADERGYSTFGAKDICFVSLCGNPETEGKKVKLYLTNPDTNDVLLRAEIYSVKFSYDENGKITSAAPDKLLGKSGFLRPGEYVEDINLKRNLKDDMTYVMIKISSYIEETGTSGGFFYINTAIFK